jgi:hypothetical protein
MRTQHTEKPTANQPRTIEIDHPIGTAASYRERQDAPVHAIALCALRKESLLKYGRVATKSLLSSLCTAWVCFHLRWWEWPKS